jgi:hypothetical protein
MSSLACAMMLAVASGLVGQLKADVPRPAQLAGTWRGTSTCTDRVAAPACNDENVIYEFTDGAKPGTVHWKADKVVNGQREPMGEADLAYDTTEACWKVELKGLRVTSVWRLSVNGARLTGTARQLPGDQVVRKIDLRKASQAHGPARS